MLTVLIYELNNKAKYSHFQINGPDTQPKPTPYANHTQNPSENSLLMWLFNFLINHQKAPISIDVFTTGSTEKISTSRNGHHQAAMPRHVHYSTGNYNCFE